MKSLDSTTIYSRCSSTNKTGINLVSTVGSVQSCNEVDKFDFRLVFAPNAKILQVYRSRSHKDAIHGSDLVSRASDDAFNDKS